MSKPSPPVSVSFPRRPQKPVPYHGSSLLPTMMSAALPPSTSSMLLTESVPRPVATPVTRLMLTDVVAALKSSVSVPLPPTKVSLLVVAVPPPMKTSLPSSPS